MTTHRMHGEWGEVTPEAARAINRHPRRRGRDPGRHHALRLIGIGGGHPGRRGSSPSKALPKYSSIRAIAFA